MNYDKENLLKMLETFKRRRFNSLLNIGSILFWVHDQRAGEVGFHVVQRNKDNSTYRSADTILSKKESTISCKRFKNF